jgi:hypothetical protein
VFASTVGGPLDAANVRRGFRAVVKRPGLPSADWTPRELRHSFVSMLSDSGVRIEDIGDLCGHSGTTVTERSTAINFARYSSMGLSRWTGSSTPGPHEVIGSEGRADPSPSLTVMRSRSPPGLVETKAGNRLPIAAALA